MELPLALRRAVDAALDGHTAADIAGAASALSARYRAEVRDGRFHLADERSALAYLATRLPATYAAIRTALSLGAQEAPAFAPRTLLDVGAGPGTALWAVCDVWSACDDALMIEGSAFIRRWGENLSRGLSRNIVWQDGDIRKQLPVEAARDVVTLSYVLDEIGPDERTTLIGQLWTLTAGMLVIVEPGTPAGHSRILAARTQLLSAGAHILAPCPHAAPCPLAAPDWCHFSRRVARSRIHRLAKGGEVPWEDEKFVFLAASRTPGQRLFQRVLSPPKDGSGHTTLTLCQPDGSAQRRTFSRRDGDVYKEARRAQWGDALDI